MTDASRSRVKNVSLLALKAAVTIGLLWLIASKTDFSDAGNRLSSADAGFVGAALALIGLQVAINVLRWRLIMSLGTATLDLRKTAWVYMESMFFNQALPSVVGGDALRIYRAGRLGLGIRQATNGVLLDRLIGLIGLLLIALFCFPLFLDRVDDGPAELAVGALLTAGVGGVLLILLVAALPDGIARIRVADEIRAFCRHARRGFGTPRISLSTLVLSGTGHLLAITAAFMLAKSVGYDASFVECLIVVPVALLISMAPISIAGWGLREGAMTAGFALIGLGTEGAFAVSILIGLILLVVGLFGGVLWLASGRRTPPQTEGILGPAAPPEKPGS